jgi:hypothetical protein
VGVGLSLQAICSALSSLICTAGTRRVRFLIQSHSKVCFQLSDLLVKVNLQSGVMGRVTCACVLCNTNIAIQPFTFLLLVQPLHIPWDRITKMVHFEKYAVLVSLEPFTPEAGNPKLYVSQILTVQTLLSLDWLYLHAIEWPGITTLCADPKGNGTSLIASNWTTCNYIQDCLLI